MCLHPDLFMFGCSELGCVDNLCPEHEEKGFAEVVPGVSVSIAQMDEESER